MAAFLTLGHVTGKKAIDGESRVFCKMC